MWGDVTPAERLRSVTRRHVDDDRLAAEAADALAGFAHEPASLVVACRRVLAHHRANGALWWVCARILAAAEPGAAADLAVRVVDPWDPRLEHVARLLVPAYAIGPERALVAFGTPDAIGTLGGAVAETWLVGGVGRILPGRLYDALIDAVNAEADDDFTLEEMSLERFDRLAGTRGVERPVDAVARVDCPVPPELLRPLN
jgi:hypothetical protein